LHYKEREQLRLNVNALVEATIEGMQMAEEWYLEDILHSELDDAFPLDKAVEEFGQDIAIPEREDHATL
jgi:hypothetical protein